MNPIFKSPMADFGYDISNYRKIDPLYGSNKDLLELLQKLHELDIKLLLDLVPNHSSDEHEWFQKSVRKEDPYTDYYVWHDGKIDNVTNQRSPPNNWESIFGGSAWTWNGKRQQYYLHQFVEKQPDLNYRNPHVVREMDNIIRYWLDMGFDGFRMDAVPFLFEDQQLRNDPKLPNGLLDPVYTRNRPGTFKLLQHWADVVLEYIKADGKDRALFLEAYADLKNTAKYYGRGNRSFMQPFNFELQQYTNFTTRAVELRDIIVGFIHAMPSNVTVTWVIGNHDRARVSSKYEPEMIDALNLLTGVLPGVKGVYYGEEIGMQNTSIRWDQTIDPSGRLLGPDHYQEGSRDPVRTPMQWNDSQSAGFSSNRTTWLPVNPNYWRLNVKAQRKAEASHLKVFQAITALKQDPVLLRGHLKVLAPNNDTLVVVRTFHDSSFVLLINMGSYVTTYTTQNLFSSLGMDIDMTVTIASLNSGLSPGMELKQRRASVSLRPKVAVLLKSGPSPP
ncbi:maltase 2-like [Homalodisca vitripennis]|uniref:maltase 2-like n=1 Tax=Homalodisca vitripennis TaxID=197043 RepID=UPI001EEBD2F0|nr:maltase 2-like [Homalodisca vitripennis]